MSKEFTKIESRFIDYVEMLCILSEQYEEFPKRGIVIGKERRKVKKEFFKWFRKQLKDKEILNTIKDLEEKQYEPRTILETIKNGLTFKDV